MRKQRIIMRKILTTEIQKEKCNAAALGLFNSAMSSGAPENKTAQEKTAIITKRKNLKD